MGLAGARSDEQSLLRSEKPKLLDAQFARQTIWSSCAQARINKKIAIK